jgi:hypothetical protein
MNHRVPDRDWLVRSQVGTTLGASADVAQLVEHHLAKVRVASSNLVIRSTEEVRAMCPDLFCCIRVGIREELG